MPRESSAGYEEDRGRREGEHHPPLPSQAGELRGTAVTQAQQAAERLKRGRGAPEAGQDYVFTGPEGGLLNVNALRDR
jgi:hypothetical protein